MENNRVVQKMKNIVSIIVPTYNHKKFISQCIYSVMVQSYPYWEMIVIDDASTDKSSPFIKDFAKKDKRIKLIRHDSTWGIEKLHKSYNQGLKLARGKFIAILEGDDYWPRDKLKKQVKDFDKKEVVLSFGDWIMTNYSGRPIQLGNYSNLSIDRLHNKPTESVIGLFGSLNFHIISPTVMIRKRSLLKIGGFQKNKYYPFIDIPTYLRLSIEGKFIYHQDVLGYYRKHKDSSWFQFIQQSDTLGKKEKQRCIFDFINRNKGIIQKKGIRLDIKELILEGNKNINKKMKVKSTTFFFHQFAFGQVNKFKMASKILEFLVSIYFWIRYSIYRSTHWFSFLSK